jgi:hypothetical protein
MRETCVCLNLLTNDKKNCLVKSLRKISTFLNAFDLQPIKKIIEIPLVERVYGIPTEGIFKSCKENSISKRI